MWDSSGIVIGACWTRVFLVEISASCFLFHATYKLDVQKYKETQYNFAEYVLIFQYSFCPCWQSSFFFEQELHFRPVKVAAWPPQSPMYGVLQYLVIGVMLFSQNFIKDQTSGRLCEFRTVGWVRYHCFSLISDVFCSAHARVKLSVCHGGGTYTFFFFWWDDFDEGQHSDFFYCRGQSSLLLT